MILLEYITWWVPLLALLSPVIWAIIYHNWYKHYRQRKQDESWERIGAFFAKHSAKYPDAAASFGMAKFWASEQGDKPMYRIKRFGSK